MRNGLLAMGLSSTLHNFIKDLQQSTQMILHGEALNQFYCSPAKTSICSRISEALDNRFSEPCGSRRIAWSKIAINSIGQPIWITTNSKSGYRQAARASFTPNSSKWLGPQTGHHQQ